MVKILVVYYSLTGNTKFIAEQISNELNADIEEVKPKKNLNPESSSKFLWGGMQASMKKKPKLEDLTYNPSDYDLTIIGTPVWAWTITPPIRSYCTKFDLKGKKIALWTCSDGDGIKAMKRFRAFMEGTNILGDHRFIHPLKIEPETVKEQVILWVKELLRKLD